MNRNQYDTDVTTWSPQGRLFQVEYAMEAVKQGSCAVGLKRKLFKVDDHMGIAMSGLTGDGRSLCKYMRNECINHRYVFESAMPVGRLVRQVADKSQVCTQRSWKRPYGVGLLVAGFDPTGPHIFNTDPTGNYHEYKAMAIGARSQAAKTYLERHFESFPECSLEALVKHGLKALASTLQEGELTTANCSVSVVGKDTTFTVLEDAAMAPFIQMVKEDEDVVAPMEDVPEPAPAAAAEEELPAAPAAPEAPDAPDEPEAMETA